MDITPSTDIVTPSPDIAAAIRAHRKSCPTGEFCGLIFTPPGRPNYVRRCKNIAKGDREDWAVNPLEWERAEREAGCAPDLAYHSHRYSDGSFSEFDKKASDSIGTPYLLYNVARDEFHLYEPKGYEMTPAARARLIVSAA